MTLYRLEIVRAARLNQRFGGFVMAYLILIPIAWAAGVASYLLACLILSDQSVSSGDLQAIMFWSALALAFCVPVLYYPVLFALRARQGGCHHLAPFALVPATLGVVPTTMILFTFSGGFASLASPQAFLFMCLFGVAGIVLGLGFAYVSNWSA